MARARRIAIAKASPEGVARRYFLLSADWLLSAPSLGSVGSRCPRMAAEPGPKSVRPETRVRRSAPSVSNHGGNGGPNSRIPAFAREGVPASMNGAVRHPNGCGGVSPRGRPPGHHDHRDDAEIAAIYRSSVALKGPPICERPLISVLRTVTYRASDLRRSAQWWMRHKPQRGLPMRATREREVTLFGGECVAQGCRGRRSEVPRNTSRWIAIIVVGLMFGFVGAATAIHRYSPPQHVASPNFKQFSVFDDVLW